jgi:hypothetical protein
MEKLPNRLWEDEIKTADDMMTDKEKLESKEKLKMAREELIGKFTNYIISLDEGLTVKQTAKQKGIGQHTIIGKLNTEAIVKDITGEVIKRLKEWEDKHMPHGGI